MKQFLSFCVHVELHAQHTFLLHLALNIWVIDDFTQGHTAEQGTQQTFLPAVAVGTVEQSQAEVAGEVGPLPKHGVLHTTRRKDRWSFCVGQKQKNISDSHLVV